MGSLVIQNPTSEREEMTAFNHSSYTPVREQQMLHKAIVVDGIVGGGKGLVSAIVGAIPNVEMWLHRPEVEQICALYDIENISLDASSTLMQLWADEAIYKLMMGRDVNVRPNDMSSILKDARPLRYLMRLLKEGDALAEEKVYRDKPILNLMTHAISGCCDPIFEALQDKLVYVRVARHPSTTYMLRHLCRWVNLWRESPRNGMVQYKLNSGGENFEAVPFHVKGIESEYLQSNDMDKAIYLLAAWQRRGAAKLDALSKTSQAKIIELPYEKFVFTPEPLCRKHM